MTVPPSKKEARGNSLSFPAHSAWGEAGPTILSRSTGVEQTPQYFIVPRGGAGIYACNKML
ncbi:MAG TPA: hypothetical protein VGJ33_09305 [Candidatus Angelobacter sp.]